MWFDSGRGKLRRRTHLRPYNWNEYRYFLEHGSIGVLSSMSSAAEIISITYIENCQQFNIFVIPESCLKSKNNSHLSSQSIIDQ